MPKPKRDAVKHLPMYHVLLGVDDDEELAEEIADAITDLPGEPEDVFVSVFHSFVENPSGASATQVGPVRRATERLEEAGYEHEVLEGSGDPAEAILQTARDEDIDAIAIGGRSRSPAGKALFGSVAQTVILNADRPVVVAGKAED